MALQGKKLDPQIELLIQKELIAHQNPGTISGQYLLNRIGEKYPDLKKRKQLPTVQTLTKVIKPIKEALKNKADDNKDKPWTLIAWKKSAQKNISSESINLILEIQRYLCVRPHWTEEVTITNRQASWISLLHSMGATDRKLFFDNTDFLQTIWDTAAEYASVEKISELTGWEAGDVMEDLYILSLWQGTKTTYKVHNEVTFASQLGLRNPFSESKQTLLMDLMEKMQPKSQNFSDPYESINDDEIEFVEVTYGLPNLYFKTKKKADIITLKQTGEGFTSTSEISNDGDNLFDWIRNDFWFFMDDLEEWLYKSDPSVPDTNIPYFWDIGGAFLPPEYGNFPSISKLSVELALNQIPARYKDGSYKTTGFNPEIVKKAEAYLKQTGSIIEKIIQFPETQKALDIEIVERNTVDFREDYIFCLKNVTDFGPYGPS